MYKSRRRPWVKLYCREWLTSTVRFDMTELDRSRFIDLLALAGDSKVPGVVCAGYDGERKLTGFPIDWLASTMRCGVPELLATLKKLVIQDRIEISGQEGFPVIAITSWKKYQSEYLRQIQPFNKERRSVSSPQRVGLTHGSSTQSLLPEVEGEGEVEVEGEKPTPSLTSFASFWAAYPRKEGKPAAERAWRKVKDSEGAAVLTSLERWKKTAQWTKDQGRYIPHPATFLNQRRWEDDVRTQDGDFDERWRAAEALPKNVGRSPRKATPSRRS